MLSNVSFCLSHDSLSMKPAAHSHYACSLSAVLTHLEQFKRCAKSTPTPTQTHTHTHTAAVTGTAVADTVTISAHHRPQSAIAGGFFVRLIRFDANYNYASIRNQLPRGDAAADRPGG